jgi:uncharacterized protein (DUF1800 family)
MLTDQAAIAANRFGLGARPQDAALVGREPAAWLEAQLTAPPATTAPPPAQTAANARRARAAGREPAASSVQAKPASAAVLAEARDLRLVRQVAQRQAPRRNAAAGASRPGNAATQPAVDVEAVRDFAAFIRDHYNAQVAERHRRAIETEAPFVERLVHFWSNHFAVSADKQPVGAIVGHYENEAIRPHVTGNFRDLLLAVERHPAMILYLDNAASMGDASTAVNLARRRGRNLGLNENLAREILELHTLCVNGGYAQDDVRELAKVLTGWSLGGALDRGGNTLGGMNGERIAAALGLAPGAEAAGEFQFRAVMHEPGTKKILGKSYKENGAAEGEQVLADLALHPATARFLATKLARHFVADEPPAALVERLAAVYLANDGELVPVYRALIAAPESWQAPFAKFKTPQDFVISAYRALGGRAPQRMQLALAALDQLGQRPFTPGSPAGWPDTAAHWDSGGALLKRIEWAAQTGLMVGDRVEPVELGVAVLGPLLDEHTAGSIRRAESRAQGLGLLFAAAEFQRR